MDLPVLTSGGNLGNWTCACTVQWCMQICHKPFPHQLRVIRKFEFAIFLLQIQIWNGCNVHIIAENPIKEINVNSSFLSSESNVVQLTRMFHKWYHVLQVFFHFLMMTGNLTYKTITCYSYLSATMTNFNEQYSRYYKSTSWSWNDWIEH